MIVYLISFIPNITSVIINIVIFDTLLLLKIVVKNNIKDAIRIINKINTLKLLKIVVKIDCILNGRLFNLKNKSENININTGKIMKFITYLLKIFF